MASNSQTNRGSGGDHVGYDVLEYSPTSNRFGWIVSYADLMTIILTFMILLLSISTIAQTKFDLMVEALTGRKVGNLQEVKVKIDDVIKKEALGGEVQTNIDEHGLKIEFSNALLFESGKAELLPRAVEIFEPIGHHLVQDLEPAYAIIIEGYTDDVPISNAHFESNWELSTSRSIHVMERLSQEGLDRRRMSVQGFADTRPATDVALWDPTQVAGLSDEELEEARASNRRVVIRIDKLDQDMLQRLFGDPTEAGTTTAVVEVPAEAETTAAALPSEPGKAPESKPDARPSRNGFGLVPHDSTDDAGEKK